MIVFKTFLKILNKCKAPIIMYTVFLIIFSSFNMLANDTSTSFVATAPDVAIINEDGNSKVTLGLIDYIEDGSNIKEYENEEELSDALFYRDVNYIIYVPKDYAHDFLAGSNPKIRVKSTGDYNASLTEMRLDRYLKVATTYRALGYSEEDLLRATKDTLQNEVEVTMTSKLDSGSLAKMSSYYNFTNYCLLAGAIFIITIVLSTFKNEKIAKRTIISSTDYKTINRRLLFANALFSMCLWAVYVIISLIIIGKPMFSLHGLFYITNSFVFSFCALTIAFLLGTVVSNKEAINGIVNVIALGSSFLCGAFVPMEWLPDSVLQIAHVLPSYWFIKTNELIKEIEVFDWTTIEPLLWNMLIIIGFSLVFVLITNIISKKKQRIG